MAFAAIATAPTLGPAMQGRIEEALTHLPDDLTDPNKTWAQGAVVAIHRAKHLIESVFNGDDDRVLFTTFTSNLAADIQENLRQICSATQMKRLEVVSLDKWVNTFLRRQGFNKQIKYFSNTRDNLLQELWTSALEANRPEGASYDERFYREE